MQDNTLKRMYWGIAVVAIVGIVVVLVVMLLVVPLVEYASKAAYLDILVEPSSAKVEIAGQEYRNAVYEAEPGTYVVTVTGDGMEPVNYEVELKKNETTGLYLRLMDDGEWERSTMEELTQRDSVGMVTPMYFSICGTPAKRTNCDAISVDYDRAEECRYNMCLIISGRKSKLGDETLEKVRNQLADKGYNLDNYQYIYIQNDER